MASRWLLKNAVHRPTGSGFLGALRIQRKTVRSERSKLSIFSSPCMRGAPQVTETFLICRVADSCAWLGTRSWCVSRQVMEAMQPLAGCFITHTHEQPQFGGFAGFAMVRFRSYA